MKNTDYPMLEVDLKKIFHNGKKVMHMCEENSIEICAVVKGSDSSSKVANTLTKAGCKSIGDSRIEKIAKMKEEGVTAQMLLLRLPMLCEIEEVVKYADISLNSEMNTLLALNKESIKQDKIHKVILMMDLGDLREGFFSKDEILKTALEVEKNMAGLHLYGVGTNLGCYGSIRPSKVNLTELVEISKEIEVLIDRKLEVISGGATSSLPLIMDNEMPKGINHLRVGEGILLSRDLKDVWGYEMKGFENTNFTLKAQVIEIKEKPSYPIGEIFIDAFGNRPQYQDRGMRKRALLAIGKKDIGHHDSLIPKDEGVTVEGSSSDHLIVDITDSIKDINIGDIMEFDMYYQAMLYLASSSSVKKVYIDL